MNVRVIFFNELRFLRVLIISTFLKKSFFFYSAPPNVEFTFNFQSKFRNGARVLNIRFHNRIIINTSVICETVILMPVRIQRNSKKKKKKLFLFWTKLSTQVAERDFDAVQREPLFWLFFTIRGNKMAEERETESVFLSRVLDCEILQASLGLPFAACLFLSFDQLDCEETTTNITLLSSSVTSVPDAVIVDTFDGFLYYLIIF